jgi:hypothetical protein
MFKVQKLFLVSFLVSNLFFMANVKADSSVGCGLGSIIFKKNSILSALLRATTNASFSSQLFGITSGTSGCSQHSIVKKEMLPQYFAEIQLKNIQLDISVGRGDYLIALAESFDCNNSLQNVFNSELKKSYGQLFSQMDVQPTEFINKSKNIIMQNEKLKAGCHNVII